MYILLVHLFHLYLTCLLILFLVYYHLMCSLPMYNPYIPSTALPYLALPYMSYVSTMPFVTPFIAVSTTPAIEPSPQVNLVVASAQGLDKALYPNSGDTNQFSHGVPPMYGTQLYFGPGKVKVTNVRFLDIQRIGTSMVNTSSKPLVLHNLLYVPQNTKIFFSVSHVTKYNQVYFESILHTVWFVIP